MDGVLSGCTPGALAVLIATLIHMGDGDVVNTFMPWVLLRANPVIKDLYPIDVLHVMPALLSSFTLAATLTTGAVSGGTSWLSNPINCTILHATYDKCREMFLYMYEDEATAGDSKALQDQRAEWTLEVRASISRVPHYLFAELLIQLCQSEVRDAAVATAVATRITSRLCARLPIANLVDLTMALCFHFPPVRDGDDSDKEAAVPGNPPCKDAGGHAMGQAALSSLPPHRRFLPSVLSALWERVEELELAQMDALVRCLRHYYGDKVDTDFLDRLQKHKATLEEVRLNRQRRQESGVKSEGERRAAVDVSAPTTGKETAPLIELKVEDLFEL